MHVFYAFTLVNWRCSRDDAAETAAATAAVDAAAGLATAPGLASPVVFSPTEEIQVKCERSSTLTFFYLLSCVYLTLSAKQIRHGYPLILEGFPLSGSGSWIGIILFNWSMRVPFLWEARAFVDWTVETTSLDIWSWMKLEDIYAGLQATGRHCHHHHHRHHHQHRRPNLTQLLPSGCSSRGT